eukprot:1157921-Pelagomonas_calceolata.AAC.8
MVSVKGDKAVPAYKGSLQGSAGFYLQPGSENIPYINYGKGDTLAQRSMSLPHQGITYPS